MYGCTAGELLSQFVKSEREPFDQIDLQPPGSVLNHIGVLLSTTAFNLEKCTLAQAHPEWLVRWISRTQPLWHITDHCTFDRPTVLPAVCPLCLSDDLRAGHSQYLRLAWYCSILTICPVHLTPMVTCCSAEVWHHRFATRAGMPIHRSCCLECRRHLDGPLSWGPHVDQFAISALLFFESLLRDAIAQRRQADASVYGFAILIEPIQDLAWALMRPVPGSSLRVLHFMQTQQFRVPPRLNTPIESPNWLASGSIGLRRCLLAVIASLILSASKASTLTPEAGKGLPFWTKMRTLHGPEDRNEFSRRTATWSRLAAAGLEFYR
jgi:TniQ